MKVEEALSKVFGIKMGDETKYKYDYEKKQGTMVPTGKIIIVSGFGDSLSNDRKVLESNYNSEVIYLEHKGIIGLLGFKMRNGRNALLSFNNPMGYRNIERVDSDREIKAFNIFKKSLENNYDIESNDFETWLALKMLTGGKLK